MRLDHLLSKSKSKALCVLFDLRFKREMKIKPKFIAQRKSGCKASEKGPIPFKLLVVSIRPGATPVPISNTMVKTRAADGTTLETMWESRRMPPFVL